MAQPRLFTVIFITFLSIFLAGCAIVNPGTQSIQVTLVHDGVQEPLQVNYGTSVSAVLNEQKVTLSNLDKVDPPLFTLIENPVTIKIVRVEEKFETEEIITQFAHQTVRNESLPEGQTRLIQSGINGVQQIKYRTIYEDGVQVAKSIFQTVTLSESKPEIIMVGVQAPFKAIEIPGTITYLSAGNAWVMESSTGNRHPVITTGNLDGRIFDLSPDGSWLLYTQKPTDGTDPAVINELCAIAITSEGAKPIPLHITNIIHHAAWVPGSSLTITYSTVEPRSTSPGWQANNDLKLLSFNETGMVLRDETIIETNSGGIYGWWGTAYEWSVDGSELLYARADGIGYVDFDNKSLIPLVEILPFQTNGDWAWVPGISWSPSNDIFYFTSHGGTGITSSETSPVFDLNALVDFNNQVTILPQSGMFTYPVASPMDSYGVYQVAYLQSIFPEQSETSRYHLYVMDQDASNKKLVFPQEGSTGLDPQQVVWGPSSRSAQRFIGIIYQGNLWIVSVETEEASQITGDGSIIKIDWE